jgi:hypothetical protein
MFLGCWGSSSKASVSQKLTGIDSQLPENPFVVVGGSKARNRRPNILGIYIYNL